MGSECCKCHTEKVDNVGTVTSPSTSGSNIFKKNFYFSHEYDRFQPYNDIIRAGSSEGYQSSFVESMIDEKYFGNEAFSGSSDPGSQDGYPKFLKKLRDTSVKIGGRACFIVEIDSNCEYNKILWYRENDLAKNGDRFRIRNEGNYYALEILNVTPQDQGHWTCVAENANGYSISSAYLNVLVPKAYKTPRFVEELKALLSEDGTVSLQCKVFGIPTPELLWYKDGEKIKAGDLFALKFDPASDSSLGTYSCVAKNCMGQAFSSSSIQVNKNVAATAGIQNNRVFPLGPAPKFLCELEDKQVKMDEPVSMSCQVVVPPWPKTIDWYNKKGKIVDSEKYKSIADGMGMYSLEIKNAEMEDNGEWKCVATSFFGIKSLSLCFLTVIFPKNYKSPKFLENLRAIITDEGLVSFECKVVGYPTPQLKWLKDGEELKPGDVYQLTGTNSLGTYVCIAKNCMGQVESTTVLTIEDIQGQLTEEERLQIFSKNQPPHFIKGLKSRELRINDEFLFTVQVSSLPESKILWFRNDEQIGNSDRICAFSDYPGVFHLRFKRLDLIDQAEWKCIALNDFGQSVTSCFIKLNIPKHFKAPKFLENLIASFTEEGAVNLECKVIGVPQPELKWYKDGKLLKSGEMHKIISGSSGTCCLGTYTCEASNCMATVSSSASLLTLERQSAKQDKLNAAANALTSLSVIMEERSSQLMDSDKNNSDPGCGSTYEEAVGISFSFDGKEVSISLYETPDLTEEEALQIVEMYADELTERISEQNVIELPSLRIVKETLTSGNILMEALVMDIPVNQCPKEEDEPQTEADVECSVLDDSAFLTNDSSFGACVQSKTGPEFLDRAITARLDVENIADTVPVPPQRHNKKQKKAFGSEELLSNFSSDEGIEASKCNSSPELLEKSTQGKKLSVDSQDSLYELDKFRCADSNKEGEDNTQVATFQVIPDQGDKKCGISLDQTISMHGSLLGNGGQCFESETTEGENINMSVLDALSASFSRIQNDLDTIQEDILNDERGETDSANFSLEILESVLQPIKEVGEALKEIRDELQKEEPNGNKNGPASIAEILSKPLAEFKQSLIAIERCIPDFSDDELLCKTSRCILEAVAEPVKGIEEELSIENDSVSKKTMSELDAMKCVEKLYLLEDKLRKAAAGVFDKIEEKFGKEMQSSECLAMMEQHVEDTTEIINRLSSAVSKWDDVPEDMEKCCDLLLRTATANLNVMHFVTESFNPLECLERLKGAVSTPMIDISVTLNVTRCLSSVTAFNHLLQPLQSYAIGAEDFCKELHYDSRSECEIIDNLRDSLGSIADCIETIDACAAIEKSYMKKKILLALVDLKFPVEDFSSKLSCQSHIWDEMRDGTSKGATAYKIVDELSQPSQLLRKELSSILIRLQSQEEEGGGQHKIPSRRLMECLVRTRDSVSKFHELVIAKDPVEIDVQYVLGCLSVFHEPFGELAAVFAQIDRAVIEDAPSNLKLNMTLAMQGAFHLAGAIRALENCRDERIRALSAVKSPLLEMADCLGWKCDEYEGETLEDAGDIFKTLETPWHALGKACEETLDTFSSYGKADSTPLFDDIERAVADLKRNLSSVFSKNDKKCDFESLRSIAICLTELKHRCVCLKHHLNGYSIENAEENGKFLLADQLAIISDLKEATAELVKGGENDFSVMLSVLETYKQILDDISEVCAKNPKDPTLHEKFRLLFHILKSEFSKLEKSAASGKCAIFEKQIKEFNVETSLLEEFDENSLRNLYRFEHILREMLSTIKKYCQTPAENNYVALNDTLNTIHVLKGNIERWRSANDSGVDVRLLTPLADITENLERKVSDLMFIVENQRDDLPQIRPYLLDAIENLNSQLVHLSRCMSDQSIHEEYSSERQKEIPFEVSMEAINRLVMFVDNCECSNVTLKQIKGICVDGLLAELSRLQNVIHSNMALIQSDNSISDEMQLVENYMQRESKMRQEPISPKGICLDEQFDVMRQCMSLINEDVSTMSTDGLQSEMSLDNIPSLSSELHSESATLVEQENSSAELKLETVIDVRCGTDSTFKDDLTEDESVASAKALASCEGVVYNFKNVESGVQILERADKEILAEQLPFSSDAVVANVSHCSSDWQSAEMGNELIKLGTNFVDSKNVSTEMEFIDENLNVGIKSANAAMEKSYTASSDEVISLQAAFSEDINFNEALAGSIQNKEIRLEKIEVVPITNATLENICVSYIDVQEPNNLENTDSEKITCLSSLSEQSAAVTNVTIEDYMEEETYGTSETAKLTHEEASIIDISRQFQTIHDVRPKECVKVFTEQVNIESADANMMECSGVPETNIGKSSEMKPDELFEGNVKSEKAVMKELLNVSDTPVFSEVNVLKAPFLSDICEFSAAPCVNHVDFEKLKESAESTVEISRESLESVNISSEVEMPSSQPLHIILEDISINPSDVKVKKGHAKLLPPALNATISDSPEIFSKKENSEDAVSVAPVAFETGIMKFDEIVSNDFELEKAHKKLSETDVATSSETVSLNSTDLKKEEMNAEFSDFMEAIPLKPTMANVEKSVDDVGLVSTSPPLSIQNVTSNHLNENTAIADEISCPDANSENMDVDENHARIEVAEKRKNLASASPSIMDVTMIAPKIEDFEVLRPEIICDMAIVEETGANVDVAVSSRPCVMAASSQSLIEELQPAVVGIKNVDEMVLKEENAIVEYLSSATNSAFVKQPVVLQAGELLNLTSETIDSMEIPKMDMESAKMKECDAFDVAAVSELSAVDSLIKESTGKEMENSNANAEKSNLQKFPTSALTVMSDNDVLQPENVSKHEFHVFNYDISEEVTDTSVINDLKNNRRDVHPPLIFNSEMDHNAAKPRSEVVLVDGIENMGEENKEKCFDGIISFTNPTIHEAADSKEVMVADSMEIMDDLRAGELPKEDTVFQKAAIEGTQMEFTSADSEEMIVMQDEFRNEIDDGSKKIKLGTDFPTPEITNELADEISKTGFRKESKNSKEEAEKKLTKEAEENPNKETEEKLKKEVEENLKLEVEEKLRKDTEEKLRMETEEKRKDAEEKLRKEAEEKLELEAEEKLKKEVEEKLRKEAEEKLKREAEEKSKKEAEEKMEKETEEKWKLEATEKMKKEAEEKLMKEVEKKSKKEAEGKLQEEAEEKLRMEAEKKLQKEVEEKLIKDTEEKLRKEAEEKLKRETEEKLKKEAEEKLRKEKSKKEAEEKLKRDAEEKSKREAEEKLSKEAEEKLRMEAEEKLQKEVEEKLKRDTEEKLRMEAEEKLQKEVEEKLKRDTEEKLRKEAEEKLKLEAEEKLKNEAEEKLRKEAEEKLKLDAEEKLKKEAEEKLKRDAEEKLKREAEGKLRKEAEEKSKKEAEEKLQKEVEENLKKEAEEKRRKEAEEKSKKEVDDKLKLEAEEKLKKDTEEKLGKEAEEKLKLEAEEKLKLEAEEKLRKEAEEKLKLEAEEKLKNEAEEKLRKEAEEKLKLDAEEKSKKEAEEKLQKEVEENLKKEAEEKLSKEADEKSKKEAEEKLQKEVEEKLKKEAEEKLRKEAEEKSKKEVDDKLKLEAEEKLKKDTEEKLRKEAEEELKFETEEKLKKEAEEKLRKEAEEKLKRETEENLKLEGEEKLKKDTEEKLRKEAEEKLKLEAEEKLKKEAEEKLKKEAEEKLKLEAEEKLRKEAEEKSKKEAEENLKLKAEEKLKNEAKEKLRKEAEEKLKLEAEEKLKNVAKEKLRKEAEEKLKLDAEEKLKKEAEEKLKRDAEEKLKREAEEKLRKEAEEKYKKEAEEKSKKEAEEKLKLEAEEKLRKEAEEKSKKEAEEKLIRDAEEKLKREAEEKLRKEVEEKSKKEVEEKSKKEAEEKLKLKAVEKLEKEAEEELMKEVEEKSKKESEEKSKKDAEEKLKMEAEEKLKKEAEEKSKKAVEEKVKLELEEKLRNEEQKSRKEAKEKSIFDAMKKLEGVDNEVKKEIKKKIKSNETLEFESDVKLKTKALGELKNDNVGENNGANMQSQIEKGNSKQGDYLQNLYAMEKSTSESVGKCETGKKLEARVDGEKLIVKENNELSEEKLKEEITEKLQSKFCNHYSRNSEQTPYEKSNNVTDYKSSLSNDRPVSVHSSSIYFASKFPNDVERARQREFLKSDSKTWRQRDSFSGEIVNKTLRSERMSPHNSPIVISSPNSYSGPFSSTRDSNFNFTGGYFHCNSRNRIAYIPSRDVSNRISDKNKFAMRTSPPHRQSPYLFHSSLYPSDHSSYLHQSTYERTDHRRPVYSSSFNRPRICVTDDYDDISSRRRSASFGTRMGESYMDEYLYKRGKSIEIDPRHRKYQTCAYNLGYDLHHQGRDAISHKFNRQENYSEYHSPHIKHIYTDDTVPIGATAAVHIKIAGSPEPLVEWLKEENALPSCPGRFKHIKDDGGVHTLLISDISCEEAGKYSCRAFNKYGSADIVANINVINSSSIRNGKPPLFLSRPGTNMTVSAGDDVSVSFRLSGDPKPKASFLKGIRDITESFRTFKEVVNDYSRFTLKRAHPNDAGTYFIIAKNIHGTDRAFFTLTVIQRSRSLTPLRFYPSESRSSSGSCSPTNHYRTFRSCSPKIPGGIPGKIEVTDSGKNWLTLWWPKVISEDGAPPVLAYRIESWLVGKDGGANWTEVGISNSNTFDVFNLQSGHSYNFRVTPRNQYGYGEAVVTKEPIPVGDAAEFPQFEKPLPGEMKALLGSSVILECQLKNYVRTGVKWYKDGEEYVGNEHHRISNENGRCRLHINEITLEDGGRYVCEACNVYGKASTFVALMAATDIRIINTEDKVKRIKGNAEVIDRAPQFTMRLRDRRVQMTYPVRLTCQVIGYPTPSVVWYKDEYPVKEDENYSLFKDADNFYTLEISHAMLGNAGSYSISASNSSGSVSCTCYLVVDRGIKAYEAPKFADKLDKTYSVQEGDLLRIKTRVGAYPAVGISWYREGIRLRLSRRVLTTLDHDGTIELTIAGARKSDTGIYTCAARNEVGNAECSTLISVVTNDESDSHVATPKNIVNGAKEEVPSFIMKPRSCDAMEGDDVIIECEIKANPEAEIFWLRDGLKLEYYRDGGDFKLTSNNLGDCRVAHHLEISGVKFDHTGAYTFIARNKAGEAKTIVSLQVYAKGQKIRHLNESKTKISKSEKMPKILKHLNNIECCEGDFVQFEIELEMEEGQTAADFSILWFKANMLVRIGGDFEPSIDGNKCKLAIKKVYEEDEGCYRCVISNNIGSVTSQAKLTVLAENDLRFSASPNSRYAAPKFYAVPHNKVAQVGDSVKFQCAISGNPDVVAVWDKDGDEILPSVRFGVKEDGDLKILEISDVRLDDSGLYRIVAENIHGKVEKAARLDVIGNDRRAGEVHQQMCEKNGNANSDASKITNAGGKITISCYAQDNPKNTAWFKDGESITNCAKTFSWYDLSKAYLEINDLCPSDSACYAFFSENDKSRIAASFELIVLNNGERSEFLLQPPLLFSDSHSELHSHVGKAHELSADFSGRKSEEIDIFRNSMRFLKCPQSCVVPLGQNVSFFAEVARYAGKYPKIIWNVAGGSVTDNTAKYKLIEGEGYSQLLIEGVHYNDAGRITCMAYIGEDENNFIETMADLTVKEEGDIDEKSDLSVGKACEHDPIPSSGEFYPVDVLKGPENQCIPVGGTARLCVTFDGCPEPFVTWLKAGKKIVFDDRTSVSTKRGYSVLTIENVGVNDSAKYEVWIGNTMSEEYRTTSLAVQDTANPPSKLTAVSTGANVTLSWSCPTYDGGCKITGYVVQARVLKPHSEWKTIVRKCEYLSCAIDAFLSKGEKYVFRVMAENAHGLSVPSEESDVLTYGEEISRCPPLSPMNSGCVVLENGKVFGDKFEKGDKIGVGNFGVVHKVYEKGTNRLYAAKFVRTVIALARENVQNEIDVLNGLKHPKLVVLLAAYENTREIILVMECILGGELFHRVIRDDFTLTERQVIFFMRQICEGVAYIHENNVVHMDLKPENIMCVSPSSNEIKLIDFGLAKKLQPGGKIQLMAGTPEFVSPEVVNYEPIGTECDMWSVGVLCYVLLSGGSPFLGEDTTETYVNITRGEYEFDEESFSTISTDATDFISALLVKNRKKRLTAVQCLRHKWLSQHDETMSCVQLDTEKLKKFVVRRKWQKTGNAIRALGRMTHLTASRTNASQPQAGSPKGSFAASSRNPNLLPLNEEEEEKEEEEEGEKAAGTNGGSINVNGTSHSSRRLVEKEKKFVENDEAVVLNLSVEEGSMNGTGEKEKICFASAVKNGNGIAAAGKNVRSGSALENDLEKEGDDGAVISVELAKSYAPRDLMERLNDEGAAAYKNGEGVVAGCSSSAHVTKRLSPCVNNIVAKLEQASTTAVASRNASSKIEKAKGSGNFPSNSGLESKNGRGSHSNSTSARPGAILRSSDAKRDKKVQSEYEVAKTNFQQARAFWNKEQI